MRFDQKIDDGRVGDYQMWFPIHVNRKHEEKMFICKSQSYRFVLRRRLRSLIFIHSTQDIFRGMILHQRAMKKLERNKLVIKND